MWWSAACVFFLWNGDDNDDYYNGNDNGNGNDSAFGLVFLYFFMFFMASTAFCFFVAGERRMRDKFSHERNEELEKYQEIGPRGLPRFA